MLSADGPPLNDLNDEQIQKLLGEVAPKVRELMEGATLAIDYYKEAVTTGRTTDDGRADAAFRECDHRVLGVDPRPCVEHLGLGGGVFQPPRKASSIVPDVVTRGLPVPASASPSVSMARRSAATALSKSPANMASCLMTPSAAAAAPARPSRSPRCTSAPAAVNAAADLSERVRHTPGQALGPGV
jgi:hypothetical protein